MARPPNMSDRLPTHIKEWMASQPAARLVESQTTAAERTAAAMMDHATEEPMKSHPMQPHIDAWRATRKDADAAELARYRALGSYEQVKATCDDHARMVREREAEAWVSVEERLPNDSETKLVWQSPGCAIMGCAAAAQLQGGRWCRVDGGGWRTATSVTHWHSIVPPVPR